MIRLPEKMSLRVLSKGTGFPDGIVVRDNIYECAVDGDFFVMIFISYEANIS